MQKTLLNHSTNGTAVNGKKPKPFEEIGTGGIEAWGGWINQAYHADLYWPSVYPLYNRIRRSDPEIGGIVRPTMLTLARQTGIVWELPDDPSDGDKRAQEYGQELIDDMEGGEARLIEEAIGHVPFMGFGLWEIVLGKRDPNWRSPGNDEWRSQYSDGLPAIRRFAWRDHASFQKWEMDAKSGKVLGFWQHDAPNPQIMIPSNRLLHMTFGDPNNPEGLSPLEAVWRLERIKFGLEVVQGIGYEHTAGYLKFLAEKTLTPEDKKNIRNTARAVMSAQESNYLALPDGIDADIIDTPFAAAGSILEAIRYYGLLKLQVYNMQFVAMATTGGTGSFAASSDSSEMAIMSFNGMMEGFANQLDQQIARPIFEHPQVKARFPNMTKRPKLTISPIEKVIPLTELSGFIQALAPIVPMDEEDFIAIRRKSGFLPESLPDEGTAVIAEVDDSSGDGEPNEVIMTQGRMIELAAGSDGAQEIADNLQQEIVAIYLNWLVEAAAQLEQNDNEETLLALLLLLMSRVRLRVELRAAQLADENGLTGEALDAMNLAIQDTLGYFESVTINRVEAKIQAALDSDTIEVADQTGIAASIGMVGGALWTAYQASKQAAAIAAGVELEARWVGPEVGACAPCVDQIMQRWRPVERVPMPGVGVCLGLTNCRHDIEYRNPETGAVSLVPEDLI